MSDDRYGFIGLGAMGAPMAANLAKLRPDLIVYDIAGTAERAPAGAKIADSVGEVAAAADIVFTSLPDGAAVNAVIDDILDRNDRRLRTLVDLSTIGIDAAKTHDGKLTAAGLTYCDAPVSGGVAGARAATIAGMFSGPQSVFERLEPSLNAFCGNVFYVGAEPGLGQTMKLLNNFLSGTAMVATAEAMAFGAAHGLDMGLMLDVVNVSSGRNMATADKYLHRVLTETYDAGFTNTLMSKDLRLYHEAAADAGLADAVSQVVDRVMSDFAAEAPDTDFTRIYPYVRDGKA